MNEAHTFLKVMVLGVFRAMAAQRGRGPFPRHKRRVFAASEIPSTRCRSASSASTACGYLSTRQVPSPPAFGLRAWDEHVRCDPECQPVKIPLTEEGREAERGLALFQQCVSFFALRSIQKEVIMRDEVRAGGFRMCARRRSASSAGVSLRVSAAGEPALAIRQRLALIFIVFTEGESGRFHPAGEFIDELVDIAVHDALDVES